MTKDQFSHLLTSVVLPLFTGAAIIGEEVSSFRDFEVAQGLKGTMLIKSQKNDDYRFIIKRNQPFKSNDIVLVKAILSELMIIASYGIEEGAYLKKLQESAIEKAICSYLSEHSSKTLMGLISEISKWSERTYEGKKLNFGFVINETLDSSLSTNQIHYNSLLQHDFITQLSDGTISTLELDKNGFLVGHVIFEKQRAVATICPNPYINFAKYCTERKIGVTLFKNGDIYLFKNHSLLFAKRRGVWNSYEHDTIIDLLSNKFNRTMKEIRRAIYITALDVSFAGNGGCIVYLNRDNNNNVLNHIDKKDILTLQHFEIKKNMEKTESEKLYNMIGFGQFLEITNLNYKDYLNEKKCIKASTLHTIINGRKFHELHRKLREELVSMDGAVVVDYDGTIIAVGAIIKIEAGSSAGGRLAAAKTLCKYGVSMKISTDSTIQGFIYDKRVNTPKTIFSIG